MVGGICIVKGKEKICEMEGPHAEIRAASYLPGFRRALFWTELHTCHRVVGS
jgi:hypothetical protein